MSIESPETYGDQYGRMQFEAATAFEEAAEQTIKAYIPSIFSDAEIRASIPFDILPKLESMFEFKEQGLAGIGGRFVSEIADQAVSMVMTPALRKTQYAANRLFQNMLLTPDQATSLFRRKRYAQEDIDNSFRIAGFNSIQQSLAYQASSPFPAIPELLRWARYHGDPSNTWGTLFDVVDLDPVDYPRFEWLSRQQLATDQITALLKRGTLIQSQADTMLQETGWLQKDTDKIIDLSYVIPNAMLLLQGNLHAGESNETIFDDFGHADIHPDYQQKYFDAVLTKPASGDLVAYHLRQENDLSGLENDLKRIGVHPEYFNVYKTLADRIPPVADIISMAVREAFSPSVAARFGQYEDFPSEFARYAAQQGMSEDWAKRYWAAHWGLPSPQQGFEMLHRGVIDEGDLSLLMKAQDIMPFWRDKMTAIAYRVLTRVDVRRMYELGVMSRQEVFESYKDAGYSNQNAERMTAFTVAYIREKQTHSAQEDIIKAYAQRMIDRPDTYNLLRGIDLQPELIDFLLDDIDYKRDWDLTAAKIKAVRNLYRRGQYDENGAIAELSKLDLPSDTVRVLMEQWWYDKKGDAAKTWSKAETFKFLKKELIDRDRAIVEFQAMGYDPEHIDIYMKGI